MVSFKRMNPNPTNNNNNKHNHLPTTKLDNNVLGHTLHLCEMCVVVVFGANPQNTRNRFCFKTKKMNCVVHSEYSKMVFTRCTHTHTHSAGNIRNAGTPNSVDIYRFIWPQTHHQSQPINTGVYYVYCLKYICIYTCNTIYKHIPTQYPLYIYIYT